MASLLSLTRRSRAKRREDQPEHIDAERESIAYIYHFLSILIVIYLPIWAIRHSVTRRLAARSYPDRAIVSVAQRVNE